MKKVLSLLSALALCATPVLADPEIEEWKTPHAMGCMLLRECVEDTHRIYNVADLKKHITHPNYDNIKQEADAILVELDKMGVEVYLADDRYFTRGVAGSYHTKMNNFYLNDSYVDDPIQLIQTLRHEAWHAAQDAMAGTIDNTFMAVIVDDTTIPNLYVMMTEIAYPEAARPWEQEAKWAGDTANMTLDVLRAINNSNGRPWEVLEPTPMTREWLQDNGYI